MADTMDFSWLAPLLTGGADLANARLSMNDAQRAAGMADPWSANRGQYQDLLNQFMGTNAVNPAANTARTSSAWDQLQALLGDPSKITNMPGYQFGLDQSLEAVNRGAGASGMLNSGNRLAALQDRGQGYARQAYNDEIAHMFQNLTGGIAADRLGLGAQQQGFGQLAGLAGVNAGSPVAAAQALLGGRQNQQASLGQGIGGIANGLFGTMPGGSSALQAIQRMLSSGGSSLNLGGLSPEDVYGAGSGWGQDVLQGGGGGFDWNSILGSDDMSGWMNGGFGGGDFADLFSSGDIFGGL